MIEQVKTLAHDYGAICVLALTTLISVLRYVFGAKAKLIWQGELYSCVLEGSNSKIKQKTLLRVVTVENVGRGSATGIEIIVPNDGFEFTIERLKTGWSLGNKKILSSDHNFDTKKIGSNTKISIQSLEGKNILRITYGSTGLFPEDPTSVSFDGKIAEQVVFNFNYLRHRDVYIWALKSTWLLWFMVGWVVLIALIPEKMSK